jgi:hypothetical protein
MAKLIETIERIDPVFTVRLTKKELDTILAVAGAMPIHDTLKLNYILSRRDVLEGTDYMLLNNQLKKIANGGKK